MSNTTRHAIGSGIAVAGFAVGIAMMLAADRTILPKFLGRLGVILMGWRSIVVESVRWKREPRFSQSLCVALGRAPAFQLLLAVAVCLLGGTFLRRFLDAALSSPGHGWLVRTSWRVFSPFAMPASLSAFAVGMAVRRGFAQLTTTPESAGDAHTVLMVPGILAGVAVAWLAIAVPALAEWLRPEWTWKANARSLPGRVELAGLNLAIYAVVLLFTVWMEKPNKEFGQLIGLFFGWYVAKWATGWAGGWVQAPVAAILGSTSAATFERVFTSLAWTSVYLGVVSIVWMRSEDLAKSRISASAAPDSARLKSPIPAG